VHSKKPITGTFIDEITEDIPSANWGMEEWIKDFDVMKSIGIDTVILIRAGFRDRMLFDSKSLRSALPVRPAYEDLADLFLTLAEERDMELYFGLYDSGIYWRQGDCGREIDLNLPLTEEITERYGHRKAFRGWYLSHELYAYDEAQLRLYLSLAEHLKKLKNIPILMSPYVQGRKQFNQPTTPEQHEKDWEILISALAEKMDIIAFQDGQIEFLELPVYMEINHRLAGKYGLQSWSNVETFERGMPIDFLPIAWPNLRYKLEVAAETGMDKLITFEFSHFLSPNSMYASAHGLFKRYNQWLRLK
jgi:hypothetical protein